MIALLAILSAQPAAATPAPPPPITVAEFITRYQEAALRGQQDTPEVRALGEQVRAAGRAARAQQAADRAANRPPTLCMPAEANADGSEMVAHFQALPAERRNMSLTDGFASYVRSKYPCPPAR